MTKQQLEKMEEMRIAFPCDEIRLSKVENKTKLSGLAIPYNKRSQLIYGNFYEKIAKDAAKTYLSTNPNVRALYNHNSDMVLGRTSANTLVLRNTDDGVKFDIDIPDTTFGRDLIVSVERGDIEGVSFSFRTVDSDWNMEDGKELRLVKTLEFSEISPTGNPAYLNTDVYARSAEALQSLYEEHKRMLEEQRKGLNDIHRQKLKLLEMEI